MTVAAAIALLERWDNTAAPEAKGATLFPNYGGRTYSGIRPPDRTVLPDEKRSPKFGPPPIRSKLHAAWPIPLAKLNPFTWAVTDRAPLWELGRGLGDVHRVRRAASMFRSAAVRLLWVVSARWCLPAKPTENWRPAAVMAGFWRLSLVTCPARFPCWPTARALAATLPPWFADQAEMFAQGQLKKVAFTTADVDAGRGPVPARREVNLEKVNRVFHRDEMNFLMTPPSEKRRATIIQSRAPKQNQSGTSR